MVVLILERVPSSLRGELTRWMLEPKAGVFVGSLSGMVRDRLWTKACRRAGEESAIMIYSSDTEQGFTVRLWGVGQRVPEDFDGLVLFRVLE